MLVADRLAGDAMQPVEAVEAAEPEHGVDGGAGEPERPGGPSSIRTVGCCWWRQPQRWMKRRSESYETSQRAAKTIKVLGMV